jgi:hypothetical protein
MAMGDILKVKVLEYKEQFLEFVDVKKKFSSFHKKTSFVSSLGGFKVGLVQRFFQPPTN